MLSVVDGTGMAVGGDGAGRRRGGEADGSVGPGREAAHRLRPGRHRLAVTGQGGSVGHPPGTESELVPMVP